MVVLRLSPARCHCYVVSLWHRAALLCPVPCAVPRPCLGFFVARLLKKKKRIFIIFCAADMAIKGESRCFAFCRIAFCRSGDARAPESKHAFWTDSVLSYLPPFPRGRHCSRHTTNLPAQALRSQRRWPASHGDPRVAEGEKGRGCESGSGNMLGEGDGLGRRRAANARINFRSNYYFCESRMRIPCGPTRISFMKLRKATQMIGEMSTPPTGWNTWRVKESTGSVV